MQDEYQYLNIAFRERCQEDFDEVKQYSSSTTLEQEEMQKAVQDILYLHFLVLAVDAIWGDDLIVAFYEIQKEISSHGGKYQVAIDPL